LVGALALALLLAGCATPQVDWNARIGQYTFDQAVIELGPPDKQAKLQDGTVIAEWLVGRGYHYASPAFGFPGCYPGWIYGPAYFDNRVPDRFLRLTFGPDGKLESSRRFAR